MFTYHVVTIRGVELPGSRGSPGFVLALSNGAEQFLRRLKFFRRARVKGVCETGEPGNPANWLRPAPKRAANSGSAYSPSRPRKNPQQNRAQLNHSPPLRHGNIFLPFARPLLAVAAVASVVPAYRKCLPTQRFSQAARAKSQLCL